MRAHLLTRARPALLIPALSLMLAACGGDTTNKNNGPNPTTTSDMGADQSGGVCKDLDGDGYTGGPLCVNAADCDDSSDQVNPGVAEVCANGRDDNCDGQIDEGCPCQTGELRLCSSHGDPMKMGGPQLRCKAGVQRCIDGEWEATCAGEVGPAEEACDGVDNDCDGVTDLDDGDLVPAPEVCDGLDNDCDGLTDAEDPRMPRPACEVSQGVCQGATTLCVGGGPAPCSTDLLRRHAEGQGLRFQPEETACDGQDNDCDGQIDEPCCAPESSGVELFSDTVPLTLFAAASSDDRAQAAVALARDQNITVFLVDQALETIARIDNLGASPIVRQVSLHWSSAAGHYRLIQQDGEELLVRSVTPTGAVGTQRVTRIGVELREIQTVDLGAERFLVIGRDPQERVLALVVEEVQGTELGRLVVEPEVGASQLAISNIASPSPGRFEVVLSWRGADDRQNMRVLRLDLEGDEVSLQGQEDYTRLVQDDLGRRSSRTALVGSHLYFVRQEPAILALGRIRRVALPTFEPLMTFDNDGDFAAMTLEAVFEDGGFVFLAADTDPGLRPAIADLEAGRTRQPPLSFLPGDQRHRKRATLLGPGVATFFTIQDLVGPEPTRSALHVSLYNQEGDLLCLEGRP